MSKVMVDRELLEKVTSLEFSTSREAMHELVSILSQPADAEGAAVQLRRVIDELKGGFVVCQRCGDQEDTATLDCVPELEAIDSALSAVTAERDKSISLTADYIAMLGEAGLQIEQLTAERDGLREALKQYAEDSNWCYDTCNIGRDIAKAALAAKEA